MNKRKIIMVITFFSLIIFIIAKSNFNKNSVSTIDNKNLYKFEKNATLFEKAIALETYLTDRIGYRNEMVSLYVNSNNKLFKTSKHPTYDYGLNNEMFFKFNEIQYDEEFVDLFYNYLVNLQQFYNDRDINFLFVLEPTKNDILDESVPNYVNIENKNYNKLLSLLEKGSINYIDNTKVLHENKSKVRTFNKLYDVGHWNDDGAVLGINNIMSSLRKDGYDIKDIDLSKYDKETMVEKYAPVSNLIINDKVNYYTLKKQNYTKISDELEVDANAYNSRLSSDIYLDPNHYHFDVFENKSIDNDYEFLFFRGSYFNRKEKFFGELINKVTSVHNYQNVLEAEYYTNITKPNAVVFETTTFTLLDAYFNKERLADKTLFEPYDNVKNLDTEKITDSDIVIKDTAKKVLIDLDITLKDEYDSAYIKLDDIVYDLSFKENTQIFTSILKDDIGDNNILILNKDNTNYTYNLNSILKKDL